MTFFWVQKSSDIRCEERCEFTSRISTTTVSLRHFHLQFLGNSEQVQLDVALKRFQIDLILDQKLLGGSGLNQKNKYVTK